MLKLDDPSNLVEQVYAERAILAMLRHPLVVRLECSFEHERKLYLGMQYLSGGELLTWLKRYLSVSHVEVSKLFMFLLRLLFALV